MDKALNAIPVFLDDMLTQAENKKGIAGSAHRGHWGRRAGDLPKRVYKYQ
jgi:hypothetical protein